MNNWVLIALLGYLFFAFNSITDKILLNKAVSKPFVYVFFNGALASLVVVLIPFGVKMVDFNYLLLSLFAGACFTGALYFYYTAVQQISISRLQPIQGGLVPLFTLLLAVAILHEQLSTPEIIAFGLLTAGAFLISFKKTHGEWHLPAINYSVIGAFFFALHFVLTKLIFDHDGFITGLFWTRIGMVLFALALLLSKNIRKEVWSTEKHSTNSNRTLFVFSRLSGAIAGLLQNYAIAIGSVTIVKALQGVQFVFILIIATFLTTHYPQLIHEAISRNIIVQKIIAIIIVVVGLFVLSYAV